MNDNMEMQQLPASMRPHTGWLLALGILFIILGFLGLAMVVGLTLVSIMFLGFMLIIAGLSQFIDVFKSKAWRVTIWHSLIAVLYIIGGGIIIYEPFLASSVITAFIAAVLIVIGVTRIIMAITLRHSKGWGWLLIAGLIAIVLGALILAQWPWSGLWVIGMFVSIELIVNGWAYVFLAIAMRK